MQTTDPIPIIIPFWFLTPGVVFEHASLHAIIEYFRVDETALHALQIFHLGRRKTSCLPVLVIRHK